MRRELRQGSPEQFRLRPGRLGSSFQAHLSLEPNCHMIRDQLNVPSPCLMLQFGSNAFSSFYLKATQCYRIVNLLVLRHKYWFLNFLQILKMNFSKSKPSIFGYFLKLINMAIFYNYQNFQSAANCTFCSTVDKDTTLLYLNPKKGQSFVIKWIDIISRMGILVRNYVLIGK